MTSAAVEKFRKESAAAEDVVENAEKKRNKDEGKEHERRPFIEKII